MDGSISDDNLFGNYDQEEDKMDIVESTSDPGEDDDELSLNNADTQVWLLKVPKFLAEKWAAVAEADQELGTVEVPDAGRTGQHGASKANVRLPTQQWAADVPKNYTLNFTNLNPQNEYVFSVDTAQDRPKEIVGRVIQEGTIAPVIDDDYRQLMQQRAREAIDRKRNIKTVDAKVDKQQLAFMRPTNEVERDRFGSANRKRAQLDKKERMEKQDLLNLIFALFEKYEHWGFKGLIDRTQQPHIWLKEVLGEVAILNKRGPYVGLWELKPEFKGSATSNISNVGTTQASNTMEQDAEGGENDIGNASSSESFDEAELDALDEEDLNERGTL